MFAFLGTPEPIAFTLFGFEIRWYAIMLSAGILIGFFIFMHRAKKVGMDENKLYDLFLVVVPLAILGCRLYYILFYDLQYYLAHPSEILAIWNGGLAIHGGIIFGILGVLIVAKHHKFNFLQLTDLLAPSLALGQAIGRWGNYFNMEAHGGQTNLPWAITVYEKGLGYINVHPTFLYESLWDLGVCLLLLFVISKKTKHFGEVTCWYFILYSLGRFWIEGLRTDSLYFLGLRVAQLISLGLILLGIVGIVLIKKFNKPRMENDEQS